MKEKKYMEAAQIYDTIGQKGFSEYQKINTRQVEDLSKTYSINELELENNKQQNHMLQLVFIALSTLIIISVLCFIYLKQQRKKLLLLQRTLQQAQKSVEESMRKLKTDYLDLVLLHQPFADAYGAYRALEEMYEEGKIRAIGISNFYVDRMVDFASFNRIKPMVNQVETHIFNQQRELKEWADKYGIQMEAWAPFGEGRGGTFDNPVITGIAEKYGKTPAQIMLRWHIQRGVVVIPKSTHIERMEENFNVFDFSISDEDMAEIAKLDKAQSSFFSHQDPKMVEWFVNMVEERKKNHDSSRENKNW